MLYDALEKNDRRLMCLALNDCAMPFWSFLLKDYRERYVSSEQSQPFQLDSFSERASTSIKLQVKTVNDSLVATEHESELAGWPLSFPNPAPRAATFSRQEVDFLERVTSAVFRTRVRQVEFCLKTSWWRDSSGLEEEVE